VVGFIDRGVCIQARIGHDAVDKVINYSGDTIDTAKALIKTWLILDGYGISSSKAVALCRCVTLINPDRITTSDCAAPHYSSINTDIDLVMLGRCAEDPRIL
jgi:hypothetical protein